MGIYTKKGDRGKTSNVLGHIYSKADMMMELQGSIDEVNAHVGQLRSLLKENNTLLYNKINDILKSIQYNLFVLGVEVSLEFTESKIKICEAENLEKEIDTMTNEMEPLKNFIYQSGNLKATSAHIIRSIVRRTERVFVRVLENREYPESYQYINRLSDYFFTLARYLNYVDKKEKEEILIIK